MKVIKTIKTIKINSVDTNFTKVNIFYEENDDLWLKFDLMPDDV